jgi:tetratricopeptide (TPR) repeat protein
MAGVCARMVYSSSPRSCVSLILFHAAWLLCAVPPALADEFLSRTDPKFKQAEEVYRSLIRSIGDSRTPPELRMVRGKSSVFDIAMFAPTQHRVLIEERFVDVAQRLAPSEGPHALALILGHELAHFYRSHPWALEFGKGFAERQRQPGNGGPATRDGLNREERRRLEAEADYFGGFYSFLAGYHPLRVASPVFDAVYREYRFDTSLPGYERLQDRKAAAREAQARLRRLEPLFEAGMFLALVKDHLNAWRVFDRIAADFPGPEIVNNAGVSLANEALRWFTESEQAFVYPLSLDADTRLADSGRGGEAGDEERRERRTALLEEAQARFERALVLLPGYVSGIVNLACVLDLLGRHQAALEKAREALQIAGRGAEGREAQVIAGIAAARLGRIDEAREALNAARQLGSPFAEKNLSVMAGSIMSTGQADRTEQKPLRPERIDGINVGDIRLADVLSDPDAEMLLRWEADEDMPELQIVKTMRASAQALVILRGSADKRSAALVLSSDPKTTGATGGLVRGLPVAGVEAQFGSPSAVVLTSQGRYYVYQGRYRNSQLGLIVRLNADRLVRNWASYRIDE